jgi:hypothetical protein
VQSPHPGHFTPLQVGWPHVQTPFVHSGVEPEQMLPQVPQFELLVVTFVHVPPQSCSVLGHRQVPLVQISPLLHAAQADPQWVGSMFVS